MRIAIVHKDRCHAKKCGTECILYCPRVRTGDETVVIGEDGKALISEELCVGCGICIKKCPFDAIDIVSLPEELEHPTHRYGKNGFALSLLRERLPGFWELTALVRVQPSRSSPASSARISVTLTVKSAGKRSSNAMPELNCLIISRQSQKRV
jgi:Pyruvate/2-oxoacid:ferredoxin oxidoreductase delta subunit